MTLSADRGETVRALWQQRDRYSRDQVYAALMHVWDWEHHALVEAFGTIDALAGALREVAPRLKLDRPLKVWRGVMVHDTDHNPVDAAIGLSWSTSFDSACWFATERAGFAQLLGGRPFVFELAASPKEIIALYDGRGECEALLEPVRLDLVTHDMVVEGTTIRVADLQSGSCAPAEAIERWRVAGARYEAVRTARTRAAREKARREI